MTSEERTPAVRAGARAQGAMGRMSQGELIDSQKATLSTPRRRYGLGAKALFALLDAVYGKPRTLSKFKVLELVARVPYQAWEQVAYIAITHTFEDTELARRIFDRVAEARSQQDNEQWHLLILEEQVLQGAGREGWLRYRAFPQVLAF